MVWPFSSPPTDRREDRAVGEAPSIGMHTATPLAAGKLQREWQREKSAHIKKESAQQSHDCLKTPQTVPAPIEPVEEVACPVPGPVSQLASPVGMRLCLPAPLCHKVPTLAGQGTGSCRTYSSWTGRNMEMAWKLAQGGFNPS